MAKRVSALYGLDIYSTNGQYIGKVEDILLNMEEGTIMSVYLKPLSGGAVEQNELKRILKEEGISYDGVTNVSDIILTKSRPYKDMHKSKKKVSESDETDSVSLG
jgi:sporulation protein YlmC with PRC-barrel domain